MKKARILASLDQSDPKKVASLVQEADKLKMAIEADKVRLRAELEEVCTQVLGLE